MGWTQANEARVQKVFVDTEGLHYAALRESGVISIYISASSSRPMQPAVALTGRTLSNEINTRADFPAGSLQVMRPTTQFAPEVFVAPDTPGVFAVYPVDPNFMNQPQEGFVPDWYFHIRAPLFDLDSRVSLKALYRELEDKPWDDRVQSLEVQSMPSPVVAAWFQSRFAQSPLVFVYDVFGEIWSCEWREQDGVFRPVESRALLDLLEPSHPDLTAKKRILSRFLDYPDESAWMQPALFERLAEDRSQGFAVQGRAALYLALQTEYSFPEDLKASIEKEFDLELSRRLSEFFAEESER